MTSWIKQLISQNKHFHASIHLIIDPDSVLVKVDAKGRIVLPSSIRKTLDIVPGQAWYLDFDLQDGTVILLTRQAVTSKKEEKR